MEINFKGPVMPIDPYSQLAFVEILNIILTAGHIVDVNRFLIRRNVNPRFGSLSGYFRWSFAEDRFTLWQRTDYNSTMCFSHRILDLPFGVLAAKDNGKETELLNRKEDNMEKEKYEKFMKENGEQGSGRKVALCIYNYMYGKQNPAVHR